MMTVRFPNGQAVQYNTACFLSRSSGDGWGLRTKEGGSFVAFIQASAGAIVEFEGACRVYDGPQSSKLSQLESEIRALTKEVCSLKRKVNKP